jgi:hypothetical protein
MREGREAKRFLDLGGREQPIGRIQLSIRIDTSRKRVRQPVERDRTENLVHVWILVGPFEELLCDPSQQRDGASGQREADGGSPRPMFGRIGARYCLPFCGSLDYP